MEQAQEKNVFTELMNTAVKDNSFTGQMADTLFDLAACQGFVIISCNEYAKAKNGSYNINSLLLNAQNLNIYNSPGMAIDRGLFDFPSWYTYVKEKNYFKINQSELCRAFIRAHKLTKHDGRFFFDQEETTEEEIKGLLLQSLSIVSSDPGQKLYGTFQALKTLCKDDAKGKKRERLTIEILEEKLSEISADIRLNLLTNEFDIFGAAPSGRQLQIDDLSTLFHNSLSDQYIDTSFTTIEQYLVIIGREHQYNPVLELLEKTPFDGQSQIYRLYEVLGIQDDDLSKSLVSKWLLQTVALLFNGTDGEVFGADGVLTLVSEQGYGKTSFFSHLAYKRAWFLEGGTIDDRDKDTSRRVITRWISELGEVGSTMRSDIDRLKAFVTQSEDNYRLPYGRHDIKSPRHTSLCASCNDTRYLLDQTGNRRWWTVPLTRRIPREELQSINVLQLWAEVYQAIKDLPYEKKAACFRLSPEEIAALEKRNGKHEKLLKGQAEIEDILDQAHRDGLLFREMTCSEFKEKWSVLRNYSTQQIGQVLNKIVGNAKRTGERRTYPLPEKDTPDGSPFSPRSMTTMTTMTTPMTTKN